MREAGIAGSHAVRPGVEHKLTHAEAETQSHRHLPWGRGHPHEAGTAGSPMPPYRGGARAATELRYPLLPQILHK
jgi:hypothetical protein